ncbi:ATP-binding protein [Maridesulfovibrio sp.]|uniref:ATP-binding protein n=1 Tax=Maridesulfovibrio sp. TaxID=2795000 RepID=UPI0029CAA4F7|nr:ATP-binding protein [Maridesulfovibrio sp.]
MALDAHTAPLTNVTLFTELMNRLVNTPAHLTPLGVFYGFSGYGKTRSATFAANRHGALYIEVGASWTLKKFCQMALKELGVIPTKTVSDMVEQLIETLAIETRPLIIDEFDHIARMGEKNVNIIREILDKAQIPVVLIGEEYLPSSLKRWERFDNRVRSWVAAQPATVNDAKHLARLYAPELTIAAPVMEDMATQANGIVRRICHGIETVREAASLKGLTEVELKDVAELTYWQTRPAARKH